MPLTTNIRDDIRYGYAVGRVRVLEGKLLSRSTFERLLDAADLAGQKRVVAETHVGRYLEGADTAEGVERALELSLSDLYDEFLAGAGLPDAVVRYFRLPHDFANVRAAVKSRVLGIVPDGLMSVLGSIPPEAFTAAQLVLPEPFGSLLTAWDDAEEPPTLDEVEAAVDRAMFGELAAAARESRVRFLRDLAALKVDVANARLLLRARAKAVPGPVLASRMLGGGTKSLVALASEAPHMGADELATAIIETHTLGGAGLTELLDPGRFDVMGDALVAERMRAARRAPGGAEPVLAYVLAREAEVRLLRAVIVGRIAGLDPDAVRASVKERL